MLPRPGSTEEETQLLNRNYSITLSPNLYEVRMTSTHLQNLLFHCSSFSTRSASHECEVSATAKRCGFSSPKAAPLYCSIMWISYKCGSLRKGFTAIRIFPVVPW